MKIVKNKWKLSCCTSLHGLLFDISPNSWPSKYKKSCIIYGLRYPIKSNT